MKVQRGFRTELDLNDQQRTACARHAGAARFAFNWGLSRKIEAKLAGNKMPTAIDLHRELNALKKTELGWMYQVSKCAPQEALRNLDQAFENFFRRMQGKKAGKKVKAGFPKFKSKKKGLGSFRLTGSIHLFEKSIQLPQHKSAQSVDADPSFDSSSLSPHPELLHSSNRWPHKTIPTRPLAAPSLLADHGLRRAHILRSDDLPETAAAGCRAIALNHSVGDPWASVPR